MSDASQRRVPALVVLLLLLVSRPTDAQQQPDLTWKDEQWTWNTVAGATRTRAELYEMLSKHAQWERSNGKSGHYADLLNGADLRGANLGTADLRGADFTNANLTNVDFSQSYLAGAIFEPRSLPELRGIAAAQGLELLTYKNYQDALVQLRKQFQDAGFREQERKITYALKRREAEESRWRCTRIDISGDKARAILWSPDSNLANCGSFVLNRVFFDWTCQYGMSSGRPLSVGVLLWLLCSVLYFACIHSSGKAGLYRVYAQDIEQDPSAHRLVEKIVPLANKQMRGPRRLLQFFWRQWLVLRTSMFFSLMSAFNIGFRDINFGRWLRLLTREQFDIKAIGWTRVVAGWQSLISVYLLALWVLTYFGRPFG